MKTEKQPLPFLVKGKIWKNLPNFGVLHYFQSAAEEFRYSTFGFKISPHKIEETEMIYSSTEQF